MSLQFRSVTRKDLGRRDWDALADASDDAWLWHRYDLQAALETWPGSTDESFALVDARDGQPLALIPLRRITRRAGGVIPLHILESLGGVALLNGPGTRRRRLLLAAVRDHVTELARHGTCVEMRFALSSLAPALRGAACPRINPLLEMSCENTLSQTWAIDIRPGLEVVWQRMQGRARTAVRKAEKAGVLAREARAEDLDQYYRLHEETYRRTGAQAHPKDYFRVIWDCFLAVGLARVWIAELDGHVIAAENFGVYKNAAVYWTGAASERGLEVEANSLLQWTAMQWMAGNGIDWYETGEAFPQATSGKLRGLSDFKKSFGGEMFPYFKGRLSLGHPGEKLYRCIRELRS